MVSPLRQEVFDFMEKYKNMLEPEGWDILDVGTAGDPPRPDGKPGGNYVYFGDNNVYKTLDCSEQFEPDYVYDLCETGFDDNEWDLVIVSQTLEHVFDVQKAINETYRIVRKGKFAIIDCPWMYPYHAEYNYDDYWRISVPAMEIMCKSAGFDIVDSSQTDLLTTLLVRK